MTRMGMNPARGKGISYHPANITVATVTYIPSLDGYFKHRLEILKLSLASIKAHTEQPFNLMVFSNGCCDEVVEYLNNQLKIGAIDYLILSQRNIGIIGAFKILFEAVPGDIIAYADDDVLYYQGWLAPHLEILNTYPNVGMVSGAPVGYSSEKSSSSLERFLSDKPDDLAVTYSPRELAWEKDWAISTGRDVDQHLASVQNKPNTLLDYQGVKAVGSAKHFQFVTTKRVMAEALPQKWTSKLMDGLVELDKSVDQLNYLRLSTPKRYTRHLGNIISPEIAQEAQKLGLRVEKAESQSKPHRHWLLRIPGSGRILRPLYNYLFRVLHDIT